LARKNIVDLQSAQVQMLMALQDFEIAADQTQNVMGTGYVILRYQGFLVGIGVNCEYLNLIESPCCLNRKCYRREVVASKVGRVIMFRFRKSYCG